MRIALNSLKLKHNNSKILMIDMPNIVRIILQKYISQICYNKKMNRIIPTCLFLHSYWWLTLYTCVTEEMPVEKQTIPSEVFGSLKKEEESD